MPKLLKKVAEPDTFDFGKAVTIVLSQIKELSKTQNTLVDDINFLQSRKKQESETLERIIAEKESVVKLKNEMTQKIIAAKSEFEAQVSQKREELANKEADIAAKEAALANTTVQSEQLLNEQRNELEKRSKELEKREINNTAIIQQQTAVLLKREADIESSKQAMAESISAFEARELAIADTETKLSRNKEAMNNKQISFDNRELQITEKETNLKKQRASLAQLVTDLEGQASLINSEKSKNKAELDAVRNMQKNLYDRKAELDNRELHLKDREATILTH